MAVVVVEGVLVVVLVIKRLFGNEGTKNVSVFVSYKLDISNRS